MKKIILILTLFFIFCMNIFAYPSDFFKSYPNGNIKINIDWDNGKGYYNTNFYDGKNNKVKAKKNWENFWDINSFQEFYDTLKNEYSNQKIKVLINITNEEHPIGMFLNAKFYNSKGILIREANNDRFSHNTKIYDNNGKLTDEMEKNIQQNEFTFKKYGKNSELLNETYISFDYNQIGVKAYNNNILIMESSYTIKNLDLNNVKRTMSNLFENANYQNVLDGYEKFYDDNGNLELENIYKNGELVDTKEYKINTYEEKPVSVTSDSNTNVDNNLDVENESFFSKLHHILEFLNNLSDILKWIILIIFIIFIIFINNFIKNKSSVSKRKRMEKVTSSFVTYYYKDVNKKKILYCNNLPVNNVILYSYEYDSKKLKLYIEYKNGIPYQIKLKNYTIEYQILINRIIKNIFECDFSIIFDNKLKIKAIGKFKLPPWLYGDIYFYKNLLSSRNMENSYIQLIINNANLEETELDKEVKEIFFPFFDRTIYINGRDAYLSFIEQIILEGDIEYYFLNGYLREKIEVSNNSNNRKIETFYENGNLATKYSKNYEIIEGEVEIYYQNGILKERGIYKNNVRDGLFEFFDEYGKIKEKGVYKNQEKNGVSEIFYKNGILKEKGIYKNNVRDGLFEFFDEYGKIKEKEVYKNGNLIEIKE